MSTLSFSAGWFLGVVSLALVEWISNKASNRRTKRVLDLASPFCPHISERIDGTCPYCALPKPPSQ